MYYELYIDVLFLENLILDYLLLCLVRRILGCFTTKRRIWLAAFLGSASFCVLCWFSLLGTAPGMLISHLGLSVLMVKLAYRIRGYRPLLQAVAMLYLCSLLLGGIVIWMQEQLGDHSAPFWVLAALGLVLLNLGMRMLFTFRRKRAVLCQAVLLYRGSCRKLTGLWDTGNRLYDPLHQKPVSVVEKRMLEPEIDQEELLFPIPFHSVGKADGMLQAVMADYLTIEMEGKTYLIERPVLGLTEEPLSGDGSYNLILNPDLTDR